MFTKKTPVPSPADYQAAWMADCAPHVAEPIETVALLNRAGVVAKQAARAGGSTVAGMTGRVVAASISEARVSGAADRPVPDVLAAVLTPDAVHLLEVEPIGFHGDQLRVIAPFETWAREGLQLEVTRKIMTERLIFTLPGGRRIELDGMFVGRCKERLYQPLVDALRS